MGLGERGVAFQLLDQHVVGMRLLPRQINVEGSSGMSPTIGTLSGAEQISQSCRQSIIFSSIGLREFLLFRTGRKAR